MSSLIFSNLCKQSFSIYLMYDLSSSTAYKTTDTLDKTFASPAILAYGDIHIKAKELLNRSIVSAQGDISIQADSVENIGSLELENIETSRIHNNERLGSERFSFSLLSA